MGKLSKNKGRAYEKKIASKIREALQMSEYDVRHSQSGKTEPDIYLSTAAREKLPFHFECKNHRILRIPAWLKQSEEECGDMNPALVFKQHGSSQDYITLHLEDFLRLAIGERPISSGQVEDTSE